MTKLFYHSMQKKIDLTIEQHPYGPHIVPTLMVIVDGIKYPTSPLPIVVEFLIEQCNELGLDSDAILKLPNN
jgi:hypothetical protein